MSDKSKPIAKRVRALVTITTQKRNETGELKRRIEFYAVFEGESVVVSAVVCQGVELEPIVRTAKFARATSARLQIGP